VNGSYESLTVTTSDTGVCEVVLSRPDVLNRFDSLLQGELKTVLMEIAKDESIRAVVLASTGKVFSAGGDFGLMQEAHDDENVRQEIVDTGRALLRSFTELNQPIVAAVQGAAIGLGATVALLCDAVVAARKARLADTHVQLGLVAGDGGCLVWPQAAGMLRARRHLLTGDALDAETAWQLGIVTDLVDDPADVVTQARQIAGRIAALPPLGVQGTKKALNRVSSLRADEVVDLAFELEDHTLVSADLVEAIAAFRESRPGIFTGR
jgi:enoyl-CoA hydratase